MLIQADSHGLDAGRLAFDCDFLCSDFSFKFVVLGMEFTKFDEEQLEQFIRFPHDEFDEADTS